MSSITSKKQESVEKDILALLACEKGAIPVSRLDNYYAEQEGTRIPWKEFGYVSLLDFLCNMSKNIEIKNINGVNYVLGTISDKTKHISSLVARQKTTIPKKTGRRIFKPSMYYPNVARPKVCIPADVMAPIVHQVKQSSAGINKDYVLQEIRKKLPYSDITAKDLEDHIKEISHELYLDNNFIHAKQRQMAHQNSKDTFQNQNVCHNNISQCIENNETKSVSTTSNYCISGEDEDCFDQGNIVHETIKPMPHLQSQERASNRQSTCNFIKESASLHHTDPMVINEMEQKQEQQRNSPLMGNGYYDNICDNVRMHNMNTNENLLDDIEYAQMEDEVVLINDRTKFRLEKLIEKYPDGIWCSELPNKYAEEYHMSLNYVELGFTSVIHFASHLPEIFAYVKEANPVGDFKLYSAKKKIHFEEIEQKQWKQNLAQLYTIPNECMEEAEAVPPAVSAECSRKLIPCNVMTIGESVGQIYVSELLRPDPPFIEVYVVEVFTPSFFWIRLRRMKESFKKFMEDLNKFYIEKFAQYTMPAVVLETGMNCACIYDNVWHRGIIKSVTPDLKVVVMFYDYGTLKTYDAQDVYYLHRQFSTLPAQAVPCGLYNVKPQEGNEWRKGVTYQFALRTDNIPLAATIESVNEEDNSMMVTLTDTLQEEDIHINDWLIEQNLATHGKLVCIRPRNFPFQFHMQCQKLLKKSVDTVNNCKGKTFIASKQVTTSEKISQKNLTMHNLYSKLKRMSPATENCPQNKCKSDNSAEAKKVLNEQTVTGNNSSNKQSEIAQRLISIYTKVKKSSHSKSALSDATDPTKSVLKLAPSREHGMIDGTVKTDKSNGESCSSALNKTDNVLKRTDLSSMNSVVTEDLPYFGTFKSLCGGNGRLEPINWATIIEAVRKQNDAVSQDSENLEENVTNSRVSSHLDVGKFPSKPVEFRHIRMNQLNKMSTKSDFPQQNGNTQSQDSLDQNAQELVTKKSETLQALPIFLDIVRQTNYVQLYDENTCLPLESNVRNNEEISKLVIKRKKELKDSNTRRRRKIIPQKMFSMLKGNKNFTDNATITRNSSEDDDTASLHPPQPILIPKPIETTRFNSLQMIHDQYASSTSSSDIERETDEDDDFDNLLGTISDTFTDGKIDDKVESLIAPLDNLNANPLKSQIDEPIDFHDLLKAEQVMTENVSKLWNKSPDTIVGEQEEQKDVDLILFSQSSDSSEILDVSATEKCDKDDPSENDLQSEQRMEKNSESQNKQSCLILDQSVSFYEHVFEESTNTSLESPALNHLALEETTGECSRKDEGCADIKINEQDSNLDIQSKLSTHSISLLDAECLNNNERSRANETCSTDKVFPMLLPEQDSRLFHNNKQSNSVNDDLTTVEDQQESVDGQSEHSSSDKDREDKSLSLQIVSKIVDTERLSKYIPVFNDDECSESDESEWDAVINLEDVKRMFPFSNFGSAELQPIESNQEPKLVEIVESNTEEISIASDTQICEFESIEKSNTRPIETEKNDGVLKNSQESALVPCLNSEKENHTLDCPTMDSALLSKDTKEKITVQSSLKSKKKTALLHMLKNVENNNATTDHTIFS